VEYKSQHDTLKQGIAQKSPVYKISLTEPGCITIW
jgi:hypothetical protein